MARFRARKLAAVADGEEAHATPMGIEKDPPIKPSRPPVPVRIPPELVDRIDAVRDPLIPREPYVRRLVEMALDQIEQEGGREPSR